MNNNYPMNRDESYLGLRQGSPWKSVSAGPVKKNHNVKFRPHVDFIPGARDEAYPELRGSYYSRIPPLSLHRYDYSADKLPLIRNDASRPSNPEQNDPSSKMPGTSTLYPTKRGLLLDYHDRSSYNFKDHYSNGPDKWTQGDHFIQDARSQSEIPVHNSRSTVSPRRQRTLPHNDGEGYVERSEGMHAYPDKPQNMGLPDNRHKALYDRRHSHEALPLTGDRLQGTFTPKVGVDRDSPWGDREFWELDNSKRYNSLPALSERKRLAPSLLLPYDSYRGEFQLNKKPMEQQKAFWDNHVDPAYLRYLADPQNAESFVEKFVESCIQESLVLEVAAEVLVESRELQELLDRTSKPVILAAKDVLNDFLDEELLKIVKEERLMSVSQFWQDIAGKPEIMLPVRDDLFMETVREELKLVAADAIGELVDDYFMEKQAVTIYNALYEDATELLVRGVIKETFEDICIESVIDEFIEEEIQDCANSFVVDVYAKGRPYLPLTNKQRDREALEIQRISEEVAPDAIILEVLLRNLRNRNQAWTEVEHKEKLVDGLILDQLLNQYLKLQEAVESTQENVPMKQFHDDTADEEGLNTLVKSEARFLDTDMSLLNQAEMELESLRYSTTNLRVT